MVARGKKDFYKGWRLVENVALPVRQYPPVVRDWHHPDFGNVYGKTLKEIAGIDKNIANIDTLRCVSLGYTAEHKGWRLLENKDLPRREKRYNWYHPKYGVVKKQTCRDMAENYGLRLKDAQQVARGIKLSHKKWTLESNCEKPTYNNKPKLMNWTHPVHGTMYNCCAGDVARKFPEQRLNVKELRRIGQHPGRFLYHGWMAETCKPL